MTNLTICVLFVEYQNTGADGLLILADDPGNVRPLLDIMRDYSQPGDIPNPPTIMYVNRIGLKSWELPRNFSILMLQETRLVFLYNSHRQMFLRLIGIVM